MADAESRSPPPSSPSSDEEEEAADRDHGDAWPFGGGARVDDGRLFASIDNWRRTMGAVGELQDVLGESNLGAALHHAQDAEGALREVLAALEQNARTGRIFYEGVVRASEAGADVEGEPEAAPEDDPEPSTDAVDAGHQALVCSILDAAEDMSFACPIGLVAMRDPCVAADGITYDRANIAQALRARLVSPLTRRYLTTDRIFPNVLVRTLMLERALQLATHDQRLALLRL